MGRKSKKEYDRLEYFYCEILDWSRSYEIEINRHPWELAPDRYRERNSTTIFAKIRHIVSDIKSRRKFEQFEMILLPTEGPITKWHPEGDSIGNIWVKEGVLCGSAFMPHESFLSIIPSLAAGCFREMVVRVRDLRYRRGSNDGISLNPQLTPMEELE